MVRPKKQSKRVPVRLRHKIEKASAAKQRKQRKEAKKNPQWRSRLKKDPGIPNLFPFKDRILEEIEEKKRLKAEEQARQREEARKKKNDAAALPLPEGVGDGEDELDDELMEEDGDEDDNSNPMAALLASAASRAAEYEAEDEDEEHEDMMDEDDDDSIPQPFEDTFSTAKTSLLRPESSRRAFDRVFKQVIDASDVILYVLDARDPEGTRSKEVERQVMAAESGSKRLILIMNKADLVPPPVLRDWLVHLRRYFPTIPLRASNPASNAHSFHHKNLTVKGTSEALLRALKSYAHARQLGRSICVGIIGYPNVGKSSVINALTSRLNRGASSACPTGAEAGVTTNVREVKLDNKLKLLDSPGIVFPSEDALTPHSDMQARLVLLNALPPKQITDPVPAISLLLSRLSSSPTLYTKLLELYGATAPFPSKNGDKTTDFLVQVARKRGRLGKGGVPNLTSAAMTVITDWRDGRIQGWMEAPVLAVANENQASKAGADGTKVSPDRKEIVTEWAKEFKLEGLWGDGEMDESEDMQE
ncbi:MAG: hypothetical protein Q9227_005962 [Pyrenula ochraceoflavens]